MSDVQPAGAATQGAHPRPQQQQPEAVIRMLEDRLKVTPKVRALDRAMLRYNLGLAYAENPAGQRSLNLTRAVASLEEAVNLFEKAERPMEQARALNALGSVLKESGRPEEAMEAFRGAGKLLPRQINPGEHGAAMNNLGIVLGEQGRIQEAAEAFELALLDFSGKEFLRQRATALLNYGQSLVSSGDPARLEEAFKRYADALEVADPEEDPYQWAQIHHSWGVAYTAVNEPAKAAESFENALRVFTRARFPFQHALTKNNLGLAYAQIGGAHALRRSVAAYEDALRLLDFRVHKEQWEQVHKNLTMAESALEELGEKATRAEHFAMMLAGEDAETAEMLLRERQTEYTSFPEPRRSEVMTELSIGIGSLSNDDAVKSLTAVWLRILMELPHEAFMAGITAWLRSLESLDERGRKLGSQAMEKAMNDELLAPQRIRVRDTLYSMGWERPEEDEA